jgi:hypothetical protein
MRTVADGVPQAIDPLHASREVAAVWCCPAQVLASAAWLGQVSDT